MESSKATARHIKQVASDPQVAQINLMWHQHTDLPATKHKKSFVKPRPPSHKNDTSDRWQVPSYHNYNYKKSFDAKNVYKNKKRCQKCGDSIYIEGFHCPAKKFQCKSCHKYGYFTSLSYQKKQASFSQGNKTHMLQVGAVYACDKSTSGHSEDCSSSDESFSLQEKIQQSQAECKKIPTPSHLITNLAYKTRNQYLRARLHTCKDVNIMPDSVYKLVFNDPELKELAPSNLEIGTYTTDTVKVIGSCLFYLVNPDTKLQEASFYVAQNDGGVLLSCTTTLALGLIQTCTRLDYLPLRAKLDYKLSWPS